MMKTIALAIALLIAQSSISRAAILYTTAGSTYSENFNSLPTDKSNGGSVGNTPAGWTDDTTAPAANQFSVLGWYLWHPINVLSGTPPAGEGGANGHQRF